MVALICVGLRFVRFWSGSRDILFAFFGAAFFVMGVSQALSAFLPELPEQPYVYWLRLLSFVLILIGIAWKNMPPPPPDV